MIYPLLIVLAVLIALLLIFVALRPSAFRISRSATIAAPADRVFAQVNDFHHWEAWSPWAKLDPSAKNSYDGPPEGTGAGFAWSGNSKVGQGHMTIIESRPADLVRIRIDFTKPMTDTQTAEFTFAPEGGQTRVTWSMFGERKFLFRGICLLMNMDKMLGGYFDRGLASMKSICEAPAAAGN